MAASTDVMLSGSTTQHQAAAVAEKSGYFGETNKYVLPSLNTDLDKVYETGHVMKLDKKSFAGLKVHLKKGSKANRKNSHFAKELTKSFTNFEKIVSNHDKPIKVTSSTRSGKQRESANTEKISIHLDLPATNTISLKSSLENLSSYRHAVVTRQHRTYSSKNRSSSRPQRKLSTQDRPTDGAESNPLLTPTERLRSTVRKISPALSMSAQQRKYRKSSYASTTPTDSKPMTSRHIEDVSGSLSTRRKLHNTLTRSITMANLPEVQLEMSRSIRFKRIGEARRCFIKYIRKILIILCWWEEFTIKYRTMEDQMKTFFDLAKDLEQQTTRDHITNVTGVDFNPSYFKASREIRIPAEVIEILTLPPNNRSYEMIQKVVSSLQILTSFAEYPLHMQEKLAKVAWYLEVSPKRVILRQGHSAENFYFILSGYAVVKIIVYKGNNLAPRVVARMTKGQSFGEIALLHHSKRTATVESANHMALLSIDRADFFDIFFNMRDGEEPDHVTFCRKLPFLKKWPMDRIHENPGSCMFHFFRRGTIVVPDSQRNDWIYIVKTGCCRVLKRLQAVRSVRAWSASKCKEKDVEINYKLGAVTHEPKVDNNRKCSRPESVQMPERAKTDFFTTRQESRLGQCKRSDSPLKVRFNLDAKESAPDGDHAPASDDVTAVSESVTNPGFSQSKVNVVLNHERVYGDYKGPKTVRTNWAIRKPQPADYVNPVHPPHPVFIELRKLREKDVFGLEDVEFEEERYDYPRTSVALVSDGCELIMLSKRVFTQHANELVRQYIREHVTFLPGDDILQKNLQTEVNWKLFRGEQLTATRGKLRNMRQLKQHLPN